MIFIYSPQQSARLDYVLQYIFRQRFQVDYVLIHTLSELPQDSESLCINFSEEEVERAISIRPHNLLFETGVRVPTFHVHRWRKTFIPFYNQPGALVPFDIFSAVFYYLTRYEEYLDTQKDKHGRFPAEASMSYKYSCLHQPVVDIWLKHFKKILKQKGTTFSDVEHYEFRPTIDIDLLYKYLHKPVFKQWAALIKDVVTFDFKTVRERWRVRKGQVPDPFYCFDSIHQLLTQHGLSLKYFLLVKGDTAFDKMHNLDAHHHEIKNLEKNFPVFIHPSYYSQENNCILSEKQYLENLLNKNISRSRQHFIKLTLPHTYRMLIQAGITDDYSMGFPQHNGFRAGTSRSYYWYDIELDQMTTLKVHPFSWMDATTLFYDKINDAPSLFMSWMKIYDQVIKTDGVLCPIFHNYILGDTLKYPAYSEMFKTVVQDNSLKPAY